MMRRFLHLQSGEISGSTIGDGLIEGPGNEAKMSEAPTECRAMTFGEKACWMDNHSRDPVVDEIKKKAAELVDLIHGLRSGVTGEAARYYSKAISHIEDGQMNAVKARIWQH